MSNQKGSHLPDSEEKVTARRASASNDTRLTLNVDSYDGSSDEELQRPGGALMAMVMQRANERRHELKVVAEQLGVSYGYIAQLRNGARQTKTISDSFVSALAVYLDRPRIAVLLAAGKVRPEDFYSDPNRAMADLPGALRFILGDNEWGGWAPQNLLELPAEIQFFIVRLYEKATDRILLPGRENPEIIARQVQEWLDRREELLLEVDGDQTERSAIGTLNAEAID